MSNIEVGVGVIYIVTQKLEQKPLAECTLNRLVAPRKC